MKRSDDKKLTTVECDELFDSIQEILTQFSVSQHRFCMVSALGTIELIASNQNTNLQSRRVALSIMSNAIEMTIAQSNKRNEVLN